MSLQSKHLNKHLKVSALLIVTGHLNVTVNLVLTSVSHHAALIRSFLMLAISLKVYLN